MMTNYRHHGVNTSYVTLRSNRQVVRTVECAYGVLVDLDAEGMVIGIETIGDVSFEMTLLSVVMKASLRNAT